MQETLKTKLIVIAAVSFFALCVAISFALPSEGQSGRMTGYNYSHDLVVTAVEVTIPEELLRELVSAKQTASR